jgi:Flp pilus assembly protein TadD
VTDPLTCYRDAERFLAWGDPIGAARVIAPLVESEPDNAMVQQLAGRAYFASAQLGRAEAAFARVVELDPTDHWSRFALGRTLERQGRRDEAARHYRVAVALEPAADYVEALRRLTGSDPSVP